MLQFSNPIIMEFLSAKWHSIQLNFTQGHIVLRGALAVISVLGLYKVAVTLKKVKLKRKYGEKRKKRQAEVREAIQRLEKLVQGSDKTIISLSIHELTDKISKGHLKAADVLKSYWAKALEIHNKTNCLVEPLFEALEEAKQIDDGKKTGLLAGIPISFKEVYGVKNYNTCKGMAIALGPVCQEDCALVKVVRKQGALVFGRTNLPQGALSAECGNPVYGFVKNPYDLRRNPGGSSGGDAALVGAGGALISFGSDIGGSIRLPAHNCGCVGFKPTQERVSTYAMPMQGVKQTAVSGAFGPLTRDVDCCVLAMKALWDGSMPECDPLCVPLPFNTEVYEDTKTLKIGYHYDSGYFAPTPVCRRAIDMVIAGLQKQGHNVVPWAPPTAVGNDDLWFRIICADGCQAFVKAMYGDETDQSCRILADLGRSSHLYRTLYAAWLRFTGDEREAILVNATKGVRNVEEFWCLEKRMQDIQNAVAQEWKKHGFDAVICPTQPFPALLNKQHDVSRRDLQLTLMQNLWNFPSGSVPVTQQTRQDIDALKDYEIRDKYHQKVKEMLLDGEGLPVGVQVTSLRWQDEKCLRVMKCVEEVVEFSFSLHKFC